MRIKMDIKATRKDRRKIADLIYACFSTPLNKQTFCVNGVNCKDKKGCETFYNSDDIDGSIDKLNKLMVGLRA